MYARSAAIYAFKCFGKAEIDFQYHGREGAPEELSTIDNVNLILGDNGRGKSSVLRAVAITMLAPALQNSGFVPYRLVRRPDAEHSFLKVVAEMDEMDCLKDAEGPEELTLIARIERTSSRSDSDRLNLEKTPDSPLEKLIYDDFSHAFFVVGYGATRRVETGDFSPSSARKMRGARYNRVAGLFEDQVALSPIQSVLRNLGSRREEGIGLIQKVLPAELRIKSSEEGEEIFEFLNRSTPFNALSDGYRAFVGMVTDLVNHLANVCPSGARFDEIPGIVLIDEIDLHLHPSWQRCVVNDLANAFPLLQFIITSHSPLVANSLERQNIFITTEDDQGHATLEQIHEEAYGRSVDRMLRSSYFELETTRPPTSVEQTEKLIDQVIDGNRDAAVEFLEAMGQPRSYSSKSKLAELTSRATKQTNQEK